MMTSGI